MKYQPLIDTVIIRANKDKKSTKDLGNVKLYIDTSFNPFDKDHVTQDGVVISLPYQVSDGREIKIEKGDHIYCHHFLTEQERDDDVFMIGYKDIYCKVSEGDIQMLNGWNFLTPLDFVQQKTESGVYASSSQRRSEVRAIVQYPSDELIEEGIKQGDEVLLRKDCDYEIDVEGKTYFRVRTQDIWAKVTHDELQQA